MTFEIVFTFLAQWIILNLTPSWYSAIGGFFITVACIGITLTKDEVGSCNEEEEEQNLLQE
ncbi:hypothetical protein HOLleu_04413 [Holothuria leucospilota]|uniref:Uncharacterized protein n=1 Tax=Holothuria leucospilota TaxID=206669 RepID=A0A9Q1CTT8_HOLLE|nr:hypothetical protein HOLleu_04413 [Holothuria leucospilota]